MDNLNFVLIFQICLTLSLFGGIYFCLKNRHAARIYWHFGKNIASCFALVELILFLQRGVLANTSVLIPLHFFSIAAAAMSGMFFLRKLHLPSLPVLIAIGQAKPSRSAVPLIAQRIIPILFFSGIVCGFTFLLFKFTNPELSNALKNAAEGQTQAMKIGYSSIIFFILVALYEEVLFRLYLQSFLSYLFRRTTLGWIYALLLTSVIFAVGHFGILETWWIKFTQTFFIGIVLGIAMRKYGMETSLAIHSILNIFALYSSAYLVRI